MISTIATIVAAFFSASAGVILGLSTRAPTLFAFYGVTMAAILVLAAAALAIWAWLWDVEDALRAEVEP